MAVKNHIKIEELVEIIQRWEKEVTKLQDNINDAQSRIDIIQPLIDEFKGLLPSPPATGDSLLTEEEQKGVEWMRRLAGIDEVVVTPKDGNGNTVYATYQPPVMGIEVDYRSPFQGWKKDHKEDTVEDDIGDEVVETDETDVEDGGTITIVDAVRDDHEEDWDYNFAISTDDEIDDEHEEDDSNLMPIGSEMREDDEKSKCDETSTPQPSLLDDVQTWRGHLTRMGEKYGYNFSKTKISTPNVDTSNGEYNSPFGSPSALNRGKYIFERIKDMDVRREIYEIIQNLQQNVYLSRAMEIAVGKFNMTYDAPKHFSVSDVSTIEGIETQIDAILVNTYKCSVIRDLFVLIPCNENSKVRFRVKKFRTEIIVI
jgi:hypothetical protein